MGKEIFDNRKIDSDTRILSCAYMNHYGYDLLAELWSWDGLIGKSLIFVSDQIRNLNDDEVNTLAKQVVSTLAELPENHSTTLSRKEDFTFYNFGFATDDDD